jgi:hypothetical protein
VQGRAVSIGTVVLLIAGFAYRRRRWRRIEN